MSDKKDFDLFGQLAQIEWLLHRHHQYSQRIYGPMSDPHRGQGRILALLKMQPEISQKDLSYLLDIRAQSLGELLAKLERSGYITRELSETDRRVMNIKLTEQGSQTTERHPDFDTLFDCLSEDEQVSFSGFLSRLIESMEQKLDTVQKKYDLNRTERPFHMHGGTSRGRRSSRFPEETVPFGRAVSDPRKNDSRPRDSAPSPDPAEPENDQD